MMKERLRGSHMQSQLCIEQTNSGLPGHHLSFRMTFSVLRHLATWLDPADPVAQTFGKTREAKPKFKAVLTE